MRVFLGWILRRLLREIFSITEVRHSRMFLAGIQGMLGLIGVGNGFRRPRPPNRACGSPAHGSPVGSFLIGIGSLTHGP